MIVGPRKVVHADERQVVFTADVKMSNGEIIKDFLCCDFGDSVSVLSVFRSPGGISVIMQRGYHPVVGRAVITTQAGGIENRLVDDHFEDLETPEEAAKREVKEESGADVLELFPLGTTNHYGSKLVSSEYLFLAIVNPPTVLIGDDEEGTKPFQVEWEELKRMIVGESGEPFMPVSLSVIMRAMPIVNNL